YAVALGAVSGWMCGRTLPAMATTLIGFLLVRFAFQRWVRTHLLGTVHAIVPTSYFGPGARSEPRNPGRRVLSTRTVDTHGQPLTGVQIEQLVRDSCTITRG